MTVAPEDHTGELIFDLAGREAEVEIAFVSLRSTQPITLQTWKKRRESWETASLIRPPLRHSWGPPPPAQVTPVHEKFGRLFAAPVREARLPDDLEWRRSRAIRQVEEPNFNPLGEEEPQFYIPRWELGPELPAELKVQVIGDGHTEVTVGLVLRSSKSVGSAMPSEPTGGKPVPKDHDEWAIFPTGRHTAEHTNAAGEGVLGFSRGEWRYENGRRILEYYVGESKREHLEGEVKLEFREPDWHAVPGDVRGYEDLPDRFEKDLMTLYLILSACSIQTDPGDREYGEANGQFRVDGGSLLDALSLPGDWSKERKVRHLFALNRVLNSVLIDTSDLQYTDRYDGPRDAPIRTSEANLMDTFLTGVRREDVKPETPSPRRIDFALQGSEGNWAKSVLHDEDVWTPYGRFPLGKLADLDGRKEKARQFLLSLWIGTRVNAKRGGKFHVTGKELLEVWADFTPEEESSDAKSRARQSVVKALEECDGKGIRVDASELKAMAGAELEDWKRAVVYVRPTQAMAEKNNTISLEDGQVSRDDKLRLQNRKSSVEDSPSLGDDGESEAAPWPPGKVKELRRQKGWKQSELAGEMGVSQPLVSQIERGEREVTPEERQILESLV